MSGVINDPEALNKFRNELDVTVENLQKQLNHTAQVVDDIAKSWKDSQFDMFQHKFDEDATQAIQPLCDDIKEFNYEILYPLEETLKRYLEL